MRYVVAIMRKTRRSRRRIILHGYDEWKRLIQGLLVSRNWKNRLKRQRKMMMAGRGRIGYIILLLSIRNRIEKGWWRYQTFQMRILLFTQTLAQTTVYAIQAVLSSVFFTESNHSFELKSTAVFSHMAFFWGIWNGAKAMTGVVKFMMPCSFHIRKRLRGFFAKNLVTISYFPSMPLPSFCLVRETGVPTILFWGFWGQWIWIYKEDAILSSVMGIMLHKFLHATGFDCFR